MGLELLVEHLQQLDLMFDSSLWYKNQFFVSYFMYFIDIYIYIYTKLIYLLVGMNFFDILGLHMTQTTHATFESPILECSLLVSLAPW
jgi:hypothetical protein